MDISILLNPRSHQSEMIFQTDQIVWLMIHEGNSLVFFFSKFETFSIFYNISCFSSTTELFQVAISFHPRKEKNQNDGFFGYTVSLKNHKTVPSIRRKWITLCMKYTPKLGVYTSSAVPFNSCIAHEIKLA